MPLSYVASALRRPKLRRVNVRRSRLRGRRQTSLIRGAHYRSAQRGRVRRSTQTNSRRGRMRLEFRAARIVAHLTAADAVQPTSLAPLALEGRAHLVFEDDYYPTNHDVSAFATMVALPTSVSFVSDSQWPTWCGEYRGLLELIDRWPADRIAQAVGGLLGAEERARPGAVVGYWPHDDKRTSRTRAETDSVDITVRLPDIEYVALQHWLHDALRYRLPLPYVSLIGMHFGRVSGSWPTWSEFTAGDARVPARYATIDLTPAPVDARE